MLQLINSKAMKTQHLYFRYLSNLDWSIKILFSSDKCALHSLSFFLLIDCQYALLKNIYSKQYMKREKVI